MQIVTYIGFVNTSGANTYDILKMLLWKKKGVAY